MKPAGNTNLERAIESAIIVSWTDLMRGAQTGLIHVEYGFAATGTLDYLKVLSSITRGHWLLACEYGNRQTRFTASASASRMDTNPKNWLAFWIL
jgi:hypothetical protein